MSDDGSITNSNHESEEIGDEVDSDADQVVEEEIEASQEESKGIENTDNGFSIDIKQNTDKRSATYVFNKEGHTLGNALRYIVMNDPQTEFCGYSIVHPSETFMNLRIQTRKENSNETLMRGFDNLGGMMKIIKNKLRQTAEETGH